MKFLPCFTQITEVLRQFALEALDPTSRSAIILAQFDGTVRTVELENRLALATNHVNVSRSMVVEINCDPKSIKPKNRWHRGIIS
jgi:hypothetical protein